MAIKKKSSKRKQVIDLTGPQGNAFFLIGTAQRICKMIGKDPAPVLADMKSGDYEHLIQVFDREFGSYIDLER